MLSTLFNPLSDLLSNDLRKIQNAEGDEQIRLIGEFMPKFDHDMQRIPRHLRNSDAMIDVNGNISAAIIHRHRDDLLDHISSLLHYTSPRHLVVRDETSPFHALCFDIYQKLDWLLQHFRKRYEKEFSYNVDLPEGYLAIRRHQVDRDLPGTVDTLRSLGADENLLAIAIKTLADFLISKTRNVSYSHVIYQEILHDRLDDIYRNRDFARTASEAIDNLLHALNFNDPVYEKYCIDAMEASLAELSTPEEKIIALKRFKIKLEQQPADKNMALNARPKLKTTLQHWIDRKIEFKETQREIGSLSTPIADGKSKTQKTPTSQEIPEEAAKKWRLRLSVDPILITGFLSMLKDLAFFKNDIEAEWVRFICFGFLKSDGQEISEEATRKKFGHTTGHVWNEIVKLLLEWLEYALKRRKEAGNTKKIDIPESLKSLLK